MRLDAPERLLSWLLETPSGVEVEGLHAQLGADVDAARDVLLERGYRVRQDHTKLRLEARAFSPARYARAHAARGLDGFGEPLEVWARIASTNDRAHQAVAAGAPHGSVWVAEEQTAGRGRQGRVWMSPPGAGLLFTLLLRSRTRDVPRPQLLPLGLAVACGTALRDATGLDIRIRWPNDLLVGRRKLAGILVEVRSGVPAVIVGAGINVQATDFGSVGVPAATAIGDYLNPVPEPEDLLARLLVAIRTAVETWEDGDADVLLAAWSRLDALRGECVRVVGAGTDMRGIAGGITDAGMLRVRGDDGQERTFSAAEVHLL